MCMKRVCVSIKDAIVAISYREKQVEISNFPPLLKLKLERSRVRNDLNNEESLVEVGLCKFRLVQSKVLCWKVGYNML